MAYCRFSSDDWASDVYAYFSCDNVLEITVASARMVGETPIPKLPDLRSDNVEEFVRISNEQLKWHEAAKRVKIGGPLDGKQYTATSHAEAIEILLMIRSEGYHVPQFAIDAIAEEAAELNEASNQ